MIHRIVNIPTVPINGAENNLWIPQEIEIQRQNSFHQLLQEKMLPDEVSFSAHALSRLEQRKIVVNEQLIAKLDQAIDKIALKGGKESLIMLEDVAYLVSIPHKKVITALEKGTENVFTNIDSALLVANN